MGLGMLAIVAISAVLSWPSDARFSGFWPALAVLGACLACAVDNNLTRKLALADASFIAMSKELVAGATNLVLALLAGAHRPAMSTVLAAGLLGFASYGASLVLFVIGLRHLGTARTGAYFSIAPFFGAVLAIVLLRSRITRASIDAARANLGPQRLRCASRAFMAATRGSTADGGNGDTLLTLISHST